MMNDTLQTELSIIVPVYNAEKYVENCLQSILRTTEKNIEVLAIDDGSRDSSLSLCQKLAATDSRLIVYSKQNGGVSSARNYGLERAKGRYITFCDADDCYEPKAITELLKQLQSSEYDMAFFPFYLVTYNGSKTMYGLSEFAQTANVKLSYLKNCFWNLMNNGMMNSCWNKVFLRSRIQRLNLRFKTDMTFSEDGVFNVMYLQDLSETSNILYLAQPLYDYVSNNGQATRKLVNDYFHMMCIAFDNIDLFVGTERRTNTYWREWLLVIIDTIYHQSYVLSNSREVLSNDRTEAMLTQYHPNEIKNKIILSAIKAGQIDLICRFYKVKNTVRKFLKALLKGSSK